MENLKDLSMLFGKKKKEEMKREKLLNEITEYIFEVFFNQIRGLSPEIWTELRFGIPIETQQKVRSEISEILKREFVE